MGRRLPGAYDGGDLRQHGDRAAGLPVHAHLGEWGGEGGLLLDARLRLGGWSDAWSALRLALRQALRPALRPALRHSLKINRDDFFA